MKPVCRYSPEITFNKAALMISMHNQLYDLVITVDQQVFPFPSTETADLSGLSLHTTFPRESLTTTDSIWPLGNRFSQDPQALRVLLPTFCLITKVPGYYSTFSSQDAAFWSSIKQTQSASSKYQ